ncbi:MAG: DUF3868 domain-containing protein [Alistipes sp.]|nr:DUF3868 domain-containing protein [Alistipes sp.]
MKKVIKSIIRDIALVVLLGILIFLIRSEAKAQTLHTGLTVKERIENYGPAGVEGSVMIMGIKLVESGDSLLLAFNVEVNRRAINNRQSWRIVPQLNGLFDGEVQEFPTLLVTGRQKERHFKRKERFSNRWLKDNYPEYKTTVPKGTDTVIYYRVVVPYEHWMDNARLSIHQYLGSSKERRQLFSSDGYGMVTPQPYEPYEIKPVVNYIVPGKEAKKRSAAYQALIDFPMGVSRLVPDFRRNREGLERIDKEVRLIKDNPYIEIESVYMEGYASPEGGIDLNRRLATERVLALKDYFVSVHGIRPDIIQINTVTEDWDGLRRIVENWEDGPDKERIIAVIDGPVDPDAKEKRLRALPPQWLRLVNTAFPLLRRTEYTINFTVSDFTVEQSRSLISTNPELFSHHELYLLAMSYEDKPEMQLQILETIIRYFPNDDIALNNFAAALICSGEISSARRYLDKVSDKSLIANNLGLIHLLDGEYGEAERWMKLSQTPEAQENLKQLERKIEDNIKTERKDYRSNYFPDKPLQQGSHE